ncbi:hypothetical protein [uncultured Hoeflea sp.]|uniref:hypothetical protein n=1 Tax=uncultured Hoeflea sp. TaxID=538666 RepID=UPI0030DD9117|tara:strand:+ start:607 stop:1296 length:690 start_codon:yes stop_codon:yes gene_type:complete
MQKIAASLMGILLLTTKSGFAEDQQSEPTKVEWVSANIGGARLQVPLVRGLSLRTVDPETDFHLSTGKARLDAEIRSRLRSIAKTETGLQLFNFGFMIDKACASGVDVPLCRYAVNASAERASVSWIQIIHRSDLRFAMELLHLKEAGQSASLSPASIRPHTSLLQKDHGHPYDCPPDREFGACRMYMKIGDDLLAVTMLWRQNDMSHLTPFAQIADAMGGTIVQLMKE